MSEALAAFDSAISDLSDAGGLELRPGKGVPAAEDLPYETLAAAGVVAATASTVGELDGASIGRGVWPSHHPVARRRPSVARFSW
ncbi:MAG: hypothetical protein V9F03_03045 [Microthrixaceae bacterium]